MSNFIALDVGTPKHAILAYFIKRALDELGFESKIIARRQTQTLDILRFFNTEYTVIGEYGSDLISKLKATIDREVKLVEYFDRFGWPKILWSHGLVSGIRVAFGAGIPIIYCNDTPYNIPVVKLTVPLASYLITPEACGIDVWVRYGIERDRVITYYGVEEVTWVSDILKYIDSGEIWEILKRFKLPDIDISNTILFRPPEYKAVYYRYGVNLLNALIKLVSELSKRGLDIIVIPRYDHDRELFGNLNNVYVLNDVIFTPYLEAVVKLVISSGGTTATESSLLGVPTINYLFYNDITRFLEKLRVPIYYISLDRIDSLINLVLRIYEDYNRYRVDTRSIIARLSSPIPLVCKLIEKFFKSHK